ncbi:hypothetical protein [Fodinicola feengrottensis]|nr:hypothetical protein [Fodinicola feengrottensis]
MYTWIWRVLPGGLPGKIIGTIVLLARSRSRYCGSWSSHCWSRCCRSET